MPKQCHDAMLKRKHVWTKNEKKKDWCEAGEVQGAPKIGLIPDRISKDEDVEREKKSRA